MANENTIIISPIVYLEHVFLCLMQFQARQILPLYACCSCLFSQVAFQLFVHCSHMNLLLLSVYKKKKIILVSIITLEHMMTNRFYFIFFFVNSRYSNRTELSHVLGMFGNHNFFWFLYCYLIVYIHFRTLTSVFHQSPLYNKIYVCIRLVFIVQEQTTPVGKIKIKYLESTVSP